ncbi:hypothetical protein [Bradyrhizobium embrapense]|uniref:hypothetical protein n=1 Tax=Bradyrhizobium embrapense TaxID=630921 RepID=UPI00155F59CC|nr:hypothetical protein [Bradyrhizobium embrapense]
MNPANDTHFGIVGENNALARMIKRRSRCLYFVGMKLIAPAVASKTERRDHREIRSVASYLIDGIRPERCGRIVCPTQDQPLFPRCVQSPAEVKHLAALRELVTTISPSI